ncbi:n-carbamoylsarcosine amidase [Moniliophthora roreri MCA 2997]|uniref:N-carbamoylsarcosine amidase n=1 Tax=Moniliophthora roreri (strain MCA 2997) TaxID=1381753 RepID=V2Y063_MONRO|nr:n-carbamoylsarcosine amidase [Moniliophthora roreri MCA 2997]
MLEPTDVNPSPSDPLLQPPPKQKRSSVACRRCRRLRAKCVKEEGDRGLCRGCIDAGVPNECQFLPRGMSAIDRAPRPSQKRKRQRRDTSPDRDFALYGHPGPYPPSQPTVDGVCTSCNQQVPAPQPNGGPLPSPAVPHEDLLPPQEELIEGCEWFFSTYFQLGFLHKPTFMHTLLNSRESISSFLLLSMLSISARFTPTLIQKYKGPANAALVFAKRAQQLAGEEILGAATLERAQGFFLCSIWSWGSGYRDRSWIFLGIAARMVSILKISQEESYNLPAQPQVEDVIRAEVSRRTWWVIFMSDNLLSSGCGRPISFDLDKVTIPLPLDEDHFYFGQQGPATVLPGTKAKPQPKALHIDPQLQGNGSGYQSGDDHVFGSGIGERSLYGNLITIADIWARVARSAMQRTKDTLGSNRSAPTFHVSNIAPWLPESDFSKFVKELHDWEKTLGPRQSWSQSNLLAYQQKSLDMGFRGIFLIMHLAHIVLRRSYLPMLARDVQKSQTRAASPNQPYHGGSNANQQSPTGSRHEYNYSEVQTPPRFWETMVHEMFSHALKAIDLVESWIPTRPFSRGCTPMMGFTLFMAGSVLCYLRRWKWLCPSLYDYTEPSVQKALAMIADIGIAWPAMGTRWHSALSQVAAESSESGEFDQKSSRERGVEGLGRAAEEDLGTDDREGMYRHKDIDNYDEDDDQSEHSGQSPRGEAHRSHSVSSNRHSEAPATGQSHSRQGPSSVPIPQPHDTHMLYSLATAASMDHKASTTPNGTSTVPSGHRHSLPHAGIQPEMMPPSVFSSYMPSQGGGVLPPVDWQHFQTDLNLMLQDDLGTHLEYGGDGWAF